MLNVSIQIKIVLTIAMYIIMLTRQQQYSNFINNFNAIYIDDTLMRINDTFIFDI